MISQERTVRCELEGFWVVALRWVELQTRPTVQSKSLFATGTQTDLQVLLTLFRPTKVHRVNCGANEPNLETCFHRDRSRQNPSDPPFGTGQLATGRPLKQTTKQ